MKRAISFLELADGDNCMIRPGVYLIENNEWSQLRYAGRVVRCDTQYPVDNPAQ